MNQMLKKNGYDTVDGFRPLTGLYESNHSFYLL